MSSAPPGEFEEFLTAENLIQWFHSTMYAPAVCAVIRKPHHSWREMRNGKRGNETATLGYYDTSVELYIIQDMLCKLAQVFSARGSRPIHSFVCITFLSGRKVYAHTLFH